MDESGPYKDELARLISKIESRDRDLPRLMGLLYPKTGQAQVWGIGGPQSAGKSTLLDGVISLLRAQGKKVALLAIDRGKPFVTQAHAGDDGVFIHSFDNREMHVSLTHVTQEIVLALDSTGFDVILVETAGAGQTEREILRLMQSAIVLSTPSALEASEVIATLQKRRSEDGALPMKAREFLQNEVFHILIERLKYSVREAFKTSSGEDVLKELLERQLDPYKAADIVSNQ
jgi:hypothetical protein